MTTDVIQPIETTETVADERNTAETDAVIQSAPLAREVYYSEEARVPIPGTRQPRHIADVLVRLAEEGGVTRTDIIGRAISLYNDMQLPPEVMRVWSELADAIGMSKNDTFRYAILHLRASRLHEAMEGGEAIGER